MEDLESYVEDRFVSIRTGFAPRILASSIWNSVSLTWRGNILLAARLALLPNRSRIRL